MNSRALRAKAKRRPYDNSLREAQAQQTRERVLDAVTELVARGVLEDLSIAEIARRAGVSEPTLYRHFGSREALYEALDAHIGKQIGLPRQRADFAEIPELARRLFHRFAEHATLMRAAVQTGLVRTIREKGKAKRHQEMRDALAPHTAHLSEDEARAVAAVYRILLSMEAWDRLTDELGIGTDAAADAVAWALSALNERLQRDRRARRNSLRLDQEDEE